MLNKIKYILPVLMLCFSFSNSYAQTPDFTGKKIMVNPGHGGHDSDDRYQAATGFWESEGNLTKGLWLRDLLEARGAEVIMSRTLNRTEDDLPLSQIVALANDNNCDLHISIHSNGGNQVSNYALTIFNGKTDTPSIPAAKEWARILWEQLVINEATYWTSDDPHYLGDLSMNPGWTYGYGVIYGLTVPGIISEGSFHDYLPEQQRLCNLDYRKQEAYNMLYAMETYFELPGTEETGHISGIVRDSLLPKPYYNIAGSPDKFMNVNGTLVTIDETGEKYLVDDLDNGYYLFDSLAPGNYTLIFSKEDYFNDTTKIEVLPHQFSYYNEWMKVDTSRVPSLILFSPEDGAIISCFDPLTFTFNMSMDSASVANALSISPAASGTFTWDNDYLTASFQPDTPYEVSTNYTVTLNNTATQIWGIEMDAPVTFNFTSGDKNRYSLLNSFPIDAQTEVSPLLQFRLMFDAPLNSTSLINAVEIEAEDGTIITTKGAKITEVDGEGHYYFSPSTPLNYEAKYSLNLKESIADEDGIPLVNRISIPFETTTEEINLVTLDEMDQKTGQGWLVDYTDNASIEQATTFIYQWRKDQVSGDACQMLKYNFLQTGGTCMLNAPEGFSFIDNSDAIALWVWGELSLNKVFIGFDNETEAELTILDYAGWKYCSTNIPEGANSVAYLRIEHIFESPLAGELFFDLLNQRDHTGIYNNRSSSLNVYPNPYSGNTLHLINLPAEDLRFEIYDLQGRLLQEGILRGGNSVLTLEDNALRQNSILLKVENNQFRKTALINKL